MPAATMPAGTSRGQRWLGHLLWVEDGVICLWPATASAAEEPPHPIADLIERAARQAGLKGIGEALGTSALDAHSEPRRLSGPVGILAQPVNSALASRSWFLRHSVLVGVVTGAAVGVLGATTRDNRLFCPGSDESCVLHSGGLEVAGVGVFAAHGGGAGYLVGLGWWFSNAMDEDVPIQVALGKVIRIARHNPLQDTMNRLLRPFRLKLSLARIEEPRRRHAA